MTQWRKIAKNYAQSAFVKIKKTRKELKISRELSLERRIEAKARLDKDKLIHCALMAPACGGRYC